jgi:hypothetical protein
MEELRSVLTRLEAEGSALGHFNVSNLVLLKGVLAAARQIGVPVLVGASEGERDFFGVRQLAAVVNSTERRPTEVGSIGVKIEIGMFSPQMAELENPRSRFARSGRSRLKSTNEPPPSACREA